jgi:hypothetical protein
MMRGWKVVSYVGAVKLGQVIVCGHLPHYVVSSYGTKRWAERRGSVNIEKRKKK